jgi:hypothetical protein
MSMFAYPSSSPIQFKDGIDLTDILDQADRDYCMGAW